MKKRWVAAASLAVALCIAASGAPALFSHAAAALSPTTTTDLGGGLVYDYYNQTYGSGTQKIYTATVDTMSENSEYDVVVHAIPHASGNGFVSSYVTDIAKDYEEHTGRKVYAGINADFFATSGGVTTPQQAYAQDGKVLYQGPNYGTGATKRSFGFDNKGNSVIGQLTETFQIIKVSTKKGGDRFFPVKINTVPEEGGVAVFSTNATASVMAGTGKYTAKIDEGGVESHDAVATSQRMSKKDPVVDDSALSLNSGYLAIVIKGENEVSEWFHEYFLYGSTVSFTGETAPGGIFEGMDYIVGGWADLVNEGTVISESTLKTYVTASGRGLNEYADRTFFGIKEDGSLMLCAVDGRNANGSKGLTVMEEAKLAKELGLYTAIELDGGGSTTMVLRENDEIVQKNFSSQGSNALGEGKAGARKVCNAILVVEKVKEEEPPIEEPVDPKPDDPVDPNPDDPVDPNPDDPSGDDPVDPNPDDPSGDDPVDPDPDDPVDPLPPKPEEKPDENGQWLTIGIIAGVAVVLAVVTVLIFTRKRKK